MLRNLLIFGLAASVGTAQAQQTDPGPYSGAPLTGLTFYLGQALQNSPLLKDYHNQVLSGEVDSQLVKAGYKVVSTHEVRGGVS